MPKAAPIDHGAGAGEYISPGGGRGLQNRWVASDGVTGGFDSHVLPPDVTSLVRQYERAMLVRAQAAALLKQRGHDVSALAKGA